MNEQFINDLSKELAKLGTIHSVGEEWISYTGKIPSGGIPYCGQEITRETYSALWSWVQAQGLVKTESEWQSIASSQNGNVPFYSSGNGTSTFRLPKLVGYVKGASSQSEAGSYVKEGLPNIDGMATMMYQASGNASGAFSMDSGILARLSSTTSGGYEIHKLSLDASRSNPIYGNSNHVTPETSCVLFGVYAFGTVSNPSDLNVSNLASDINSIKTSYLPLSGGNVTGNLTVKGKNVVRSVNGTNADASGNVAITISSNTVSQKHNSTITSTTATKTVTGLTANKPVFISLNYLTSKSGGSWAECWVTSGLANNQATGGPEGVIRLDVSKNTASGDFFGVVIPNGTSITITVKSGAEGTIILKAYQ